MLERKQTVREYLIFNRADIECIACGKCCSDACSNKEGSLCTNHPSNKGVDTRPEACSWDTVTIALDVGNYCPPVADCIEELTGFKPPSNGNRIPYLYADIRVEGMEYFNPIVLEVLLNREVDTDV